MTIIEDEFEKITTAHEKNNHEPRKSVVQVYFPSKQKTYSYFNDRFDLKSGDFVYVDGKLEGVRGVVTDVAYNFKIKISQYKRVVALIDTEVHGRFYMANSHFAMFDRDILPKSKAIAWFKAPESEDDEYVSGNGDADSFSLYDLHEMKIDKEIADRGYEYYLADRVRYISLDGIKGYAVVEGSEAYEVEFIYENKKISNLICNCFCSFRCKHEFAVMLQLREILDWIEEYCREEYKKSGYFAAISKETLYDFTLRRQKTGSILL